MALVHPLSRVRKGTARVQVHPKRRTPRLLEAQPAANRASADAVVHGAVPVPQQDIQGQMTTRVQTATHNPTHRAVPPKVPTVQTVPHPRRTAATGQLVALRLRNGARKKVGHTRPTGAVAVGGPLDAILLEDGVTPGHPTDEWTHHQYVQGRPLAVVPTGGPARAVAKRNRAAPPRVVGAPRVAGDP